MKTRGDCGRSNEAYLGYSYQIYQISARFRSMGSWCFTEKTLIGLNEDELPQLCQGRTGNIFCLASHLYLSICLRSLLQLAKPFRQAQSSCARNFRRKVSICIAYISIVKLLQGVQRLCCWHFSKSRLATEGSCWGIPKLRTRCDGGYSLHTLN